MLHELHGPAPWPVSARACVRPATQWFHHDESFRFCSMHAHAAHRVIRADPTPYTPEG